MQAHLIPCLSCECFIYLRLFPSILIISLQPMSQHGGTFVQNPGPDTFCVLVEKVIVRANNIIRYVVWTMM